MHIEETFIQGLKVVKLNQFKDQRGSFIKVFNFDFFTENGLTTDFKESYYSISAKNVIRGMHFQTPPADHTKLVYLNSGRILDVVLDIRKDSPTYGHHFSVELNAENPLMLYIPSGCAHGFLSLEEHSMVTYLQTSCYNQACDSGIRFDSFGMNWGITDPILSDRDGMFVGMNEFASPF